MGKKKSLLSSHFHFCLVKKPTKENANPLTSLWCMYTWKPQDLHACMKEAIEILPFSFDEKEVFSYLWECFLHSEPFDPCCLSLKNFRGRCCLLDLIAFASFVLF